MTSPRRGDLLLWGITLADHHASLTLPLFCLKWRHIVGHDHLAASKSFGHLGAFFPCASPRRHSLPPARYERRVGVSLVRAAWERQPEGPAYLLLSVMLLYLAGQCAFSRKLTPLGSKELGGISPEFLWISDLGPPAVISRREILRSRRFDP